LSQNRRCSRADIEATDKLSILAPDPNYSKRLKSGLAPDKTIDHTHVSYVDMLSHLEGNLVNVANVMALQAIHQQNTSLHPDPTSTTFVITLSEDHINDGGVGSQLKSLDKLVTSKAMEVQIFHNHNCGESEQESQQQDKGNISDSDISLSESFAAGSMGESFEYPPNPPTIEFDGTVDDDSGSGIEFGRQPNDNHQFHTEHVEQGRENRMEIPATMEHVPIVKEFHGGSPQLDSLVELYTLLDKRGVANSLFDKITEWAWVNGSSFGRNPPMKRKVVVEKVFRHVRGENYRQYITPKQKVLKLSTGRHVAITYFPIEQMIKDLLCNSTLMKAEHLLISDINNPLNEDDNHPMMSFGEVNSGSWWKTACEHECRGDSDMLWPLIMFIDGMKVDNMSGKLKLEPISFTFSRFHRWVRNQDNAWRTWAYMEEVKETLVPATDDDEEVTLSAKDRLQEYHDILSFLLKDLKKIQSDGFPWILDLGGERKHNVVLRMPLQFVIGDCEGHDKLLGRFKGHTMNLKGLCRDCDIPTRDGDDVNWLCNYFEEEDLKHLNAEELRQISFHKIENGFYGISVGGCSRGIWTLFNPEMLHLFKSGQSEWQSDGFTFTLSTKATQYTNRASTFLVLMNRGQSDRSYPNIGTFRDGLLKPQGTVLLGHEKHARLFFIYMLLCCSDYISMLVANPKRGYSYDLRFYKSFLQMLEHSLGFYEWSARREHPINTIHGIDGTPESSQSQESVRRYLSLLKNSCPREELKKNFKLTKFHQSLHLASAISRHGSLLNIDGSRPESMAKVNVKDPASHTQRVTSTLSYQTGKRYIESLTFREYKRMKAEEMHDPVDCRGYGGYINPDTPEAKILHTSVNDEIDEYSNREVSIASSGTSFALVLDLDQRENEYNVHVHWKGKGKPNLGKFDEHLLQQLGKRLFGTDDGGVVIGTEVPCCTSICVGKTLYTAHPLYQNDHPWHDWVYIQWQGYDHPIPARIDMFIDLRRSKISNVRVEEDGHETSDDDNDPVPFRHVFLENKIYAVVWSAKSLELSRNRSTEHHLPLELGFRIELEDFRRLVEVESFVKPCYGFLNTCGLSRLPFDKTAIIMKEKHLWAEYFLS
jgi:hypothetical protein